MLNKVRKNNEFIFPQTNTILFTTINIIIK